MASGATPLTEAELISDLAERLEENGIAKGTVRTVVKALKEEIIDCLANGYKVSLSGLVRFEPKYVPEKRKGEWVRNPATGEMVKRAQGKPASFRAKAYASSSITKFMPTTRSADGKQLAKQLAPKR